MNNFNQLGLPEPLLHALNAMQFTTPTPVQAQAIPLALEGRDILGSAQTGTGKTGAFGIPLINHVMTKPGACALVMTPTRELAAQVLAQLQKMLPPSAGVKTALLIGGDSMYKQLQQLRNRPRIIVGTPGRINDHLQQRTVNFAATSFLVLDETDRMLDMGFDVQIEKIIRTLPKQRQTLLFSATLPDRIVKLSNNYLSNPARIAVGSDHTPIARIKQDVVQISSGEKYGRLLAELQERQGSIIMFIKTKHGADKMAKKLNAQGHSAEAIHGNLNQGKRNRVILAFREKKYRILVATDVAARGLDIPHIEHVINYDLPQVPEDYIHRIGRTARAGAEGSALCFVTPEDGKLWREIHFLMNPTEKPPKTYSSQGRSRGPQQARPANRNEGRFDNRSESRHGGRSQNRSDERSGNRGEGRFESRGENRFEGRSQNRSEARFDSRSETRAPDRSQSRAPDRNEARTDTRTETRSEAPRAPRNEGRSDRPFAQRRAAGGQEPKRRIQRDENGNAQARDFEDRPRRSSPHAVAEPLPRRKPAHGKRSDVPQEVRPWNKPVSRFGKAKKTSDRKNRDGKWRAA